MIDVGRICMKTAGRESGKFCVILDVLEDGFVLVTGPKAATTVKRRKCSIHHVEPTPEAVKIKKNATDDEVLAVYKKDGLFEKLGVKAPSAKDIEKAKDAERKRIAGAKAAKEKPKPEKPAPEKKEEPKKEEPKEAPKEEKPEPKPEKKGKPKPEKKGHKPKERKPEKKPAAKKKTEKKKAKK
ncbi:MAG: 50S ribosomal protein L14e [Candidatus Aenigmatarchaeota archaeon]|nr:MAG: 50S ribosomal protein L14e [Candidatus Aenigmarchaeota archaeon]